MTCAIAAPSPASAQAGVQIARSGGSAVDAAVAAMVVAMSTEPGIVSPLGGGFVAVWPSGSDPEVVDGNVEMPGRGLPEERLGTGLRKITTSYGGGVTMYAGHGSVATPGSFAALGEAHRRHGRLPWADVLGPGHRGDQGRVPARDVGGELPCHHRHDPVRLGPRDGRVPAGPQRGPPRRRGSSSATTPSRPPWRWSRARGVEELYVGETGRAIAADCAAREGLVTAADLTAYRAVVRPALTSGLGAWALATNPPPSIGGPLLTVMLAELLARDGRTWADVIEIQEHVLRYRHHVHDFSEDLEEDGYTLLDLVATQGLRALALPPPTAPSTAHVSVVDDAGMACAITASSGYGSGATVPGTGLMLNNCLGEPELNRRGVHVLPSGTRLASNMAPTVARSGDGCRARHRLPWCRPHHHGPDAGAGALLPHGDPAR